VLKQPSFYFKMAPKHERSNAENVGVPIRSHKLLP
jgi:hypothetical protein